MSEKPGLQMAVNIVDLLVPVAQLIGHLVERASQTGELTDEQRTALGDSAEKIFAAAATTPPPPPGYPQADEK